MKLNMSQTIRLMKHGMLLFLLYTEFVKYFAMRKFGCSEIVICLLYEQQ